MIRDILGILSDIIGIAFVWWQPTALAWYWKLLISVFLVLTAIVFTILSKNRPVEKVKDYSWECNKPILLFLNKNSYYSNGMLVSIYIKEGRRPILCAIGYVNMDPEEKGVHIQVLHQVNKSAMEKIRTSRVKYKSFFVKPSVTHEDIMGIDWK